MDKVLIKIDRLVKTFEKSKESAIKELSANLPEGKIIGLVGPDGSGKTTLIRLLANLLTPTSGSFTVEGFTNPLERDIFSSFIGYMPQKFGLYEDLTVEQNLTLYADLKEVSLEERKAAIPKLLAFTSLAPFTNRLAGNLSGGMKQKLGLACALIKKPKLLILDEPSVGVDPLSRRELWKMVYALLEEKITIIWSTAYLDEAEKCDLVLLLSNGKLLFEGRPQDLTKEVEGRVFLQKHMTESKRKFLEEVMLDKDIVDSVIQGEDVRLVFKEKKAREDLEVAVPRFEDAFIDILGGSSKKESLLAKAISKVETNSTFAIEAKNLTKTFGSFTAVNDVSFTANKGEIFGFLGPNGAGKSTTFRMLCGLLKPSKGTCLVNGEDLQKAPGKARSHIGYMAQKFSLYGNLSLKQNLAFFAGAYNLVKKEKEKAIEEMIEIFELSSYLDAVSELLPLGIKQRLSLACATMHRPKVLFLDEPTSGVDPLTRREFWGHINAMVEKGITIMVSTHFMDEAEYCDKVALIYEGRAIHMGTSSELKKMVQKKTNPTLEEAFIEVIEQYEAEKNRV